MGKGKLLSSNIFSMIVSIKRNLLLMVELIYFSNPFRVIFILKLNLPSSCIIRLVSYFFRLWNAIRISWFNLADITISMCRTSIFSSDTTIISYFNLVINIIIATDLTFTRLVKISLSFPFFDHTINKIVNYIFT